MPRRVKYSNGGQLKYTTKNSVGELTLSASPGKGYGAELKTPRGHIGTKGHSITKPPSSINVGAKIRGVDVGAGYGLKSKQRTLKITKPLNYGKIQADYGPGGVSLMYKINRKF